MRRVNEYGQPIGAALPDWTSVAFPDAPVFEGRYCTLERLDPPRHAAALFAAYATAPDGRDWTYLSAGPFASEADYYEWTVTAANSPTQVHYAIIDHATGGPQGTMALMNIKPEHGTVEIGTVVLAPAIQQTRVSTEAHYLLMNYVFGLEYRRYEWISQIILGTASREEPHVRLGTSRMKKTLPRLVAWEATTND